MINQGTARSFFVLIVLEIILLAETDKNFNEWQDMYFLNQK